jgi:tetratricopeptide (TPR) repeat protein
LEIGPYANPAQASLALRRALAADPGNRTFRLGLMELHRRQGRFEEARALGEAWLAEAPGDEEALRLLALVYGEMGATGPLLALLRDLPEEGGRAVEAGTHATLAGQWETALAALARAAELRPDDGRVRLTQVKALCHAHRLDEARDLTDRLLALALPDKDLNAQLGFLKGVNALLRGRLEEGFPWLDCRFAMDGAASMDPLPLRPWRGEDVAGRTLLLRAEQGYGDVFMMARYVDLLAGRGAEVYLTPQMRTQGVLATCDGLRGLAEGPVNLPADTLQAPILSLPGLCGTRLETIPGRVPYLHVPAHVPNRAAIDACLAQAREPLRIGLVWAGNPTHQQDLERSMPPELLEVLADVPGVAWVDLLVQDGPRPALPMLGLARHLSDFSDTAYALERLDGIISVDSSPVHLAGALGRPVWLALARLPDWRWMLDRRDTPWYPTVELWRQPATGDWASVVQGMRARLLGPGFPALFHE